MREAFWGLVVVAVVAGCSSDEQAECSTPESCATADEVKSDPAPFEVGAVKAARYPIVLHHGFNASSTNSSLSSAVVR